MTDNPFLKMRSDAEALARYERDRMHESLREAEYNGAPAPEHLSHVANRIALYEGRARVFRMTGDMVEQDKPKQDILWSLLHLLASGASDDWSGRNNEVRRSKFDGYRSAVEDVLDYLREDER